MKKVQLVSGLILALAAGCGGTAATEPAHEHEGSSGAEAHPHEAHHDAHDEAHDAHDEAHEDHHAGLPPAVRAFHDAFAHHWHGDRSADAVCADAANLQGLANAAADEQQAHAAAADETRAAAQALVETCAAEGRPDYDAALGRLHEALHGLMEAQH